LTRQAVVGEGIFIKNQPIVNHKSDGLIPEFSSKAGAWPVWLLVDEVQSGAVSSGS
jgi:hypothetical protein